MKTDAYAKDAKFSCDCCDKKATRKGGWFCFYLCAEHAKLPVEQVVALRAARHGCGTKWEQDAVEYERVMVAEYGDARYDRQGRQLPAKRKVAA